MKTPVVRRRALAALVAACVAATPVRAAAQSQPSAPPPASPATPAAPTSPDAPPPVVLAPASPAPASPASPASAAAPVVVRVESAPPELSPEAVRDAIGRELAAPVVAAPEAAATQPRGVITVAIDHQNRVTVRFRDATGRELVRVVTAPPAPGELVGTVAVLAGNLARNEADELLAELPPPRPVALPAPPPPVAPPPRPPLQFWPAVFSLVPAVSTDGIAGRRRTHVAALHLLVGYSGGLDGFELSAAVNIEREYARGLQVAAAANVVGGDVTGLQVAGATNIATGAVRGAQVSGAFNLGAGGLAGLAAAGAANVHTGDVAGLQVAGGFNLARGAFAGVQTAGGVNVVTGPAAGLQVAGGLNLARDLLGLQVAGGANIATGALTGLQVGVFNYAGRLRGLQLGVVNASGAGGRGVAIGLFNFVRGEPLYVEVTGGTLPALGVALRHGTRYLRNIYSVALAPFGSAAHWMVGLGLGLHLPLARVVEADIDAIVHAVNRGFTWSPGLNLLTQLRATVVVPLAPRFALMVGASLNWLITSNALNGELVFGPQWHTPNGAGGLYQALWPSLHVGLRI